MASQMPHLSRVPAPRMTEAEAYQAQHTDQGPKNESKAPNMKIDLPPPGMGGKKANPLVERDERGFVILQGKDRWGITPIPFTDDSTCDMGRRRDQRVRWIEGLRGILGFQVLLWIFFRIFAPAIVASRDLDNQYPATFLASSPEWTEFIRKILSPVLFDGHLQQAIFIVLVGRTTMLTYIERREPVPISGACFRRPFRMAIPVAATVLFVTAVVAAGGFKYASFVGDRLDNMIAQPPKMWGSAVECWNSIVAFFYAPYAYHDARNVAFIPPSGTSWFVSISACWPLIEMSRIRG